MKRVAALSLVAASLLAYQIHVQPGWQMKAALEDLNVSVFDGTPTQVIWSYNDTTERWQVYVPNNPTLEIPSSIDRLRTIPKERGYWVLSAQYFSFNPDILRYLSAFNRYVDTPQKLEKSALAQKSFYLPTNDAIAQKAYYMQIYFDKNATASQSGQWMLENGYLDVYDYSGKLKGVYEKMATNTDGDILLVGLKVKDGNITDTFLQPMISFGHFDNLPFVDMSQKLPYTVYSAQDSRSYTLYTTDHTIESYIYNKDSRTYQKDTSYNEEFTIENGKIKIKHVQPNYSETKYIQIIDEIGRYDIVQIDEEINATCLDSTLIGKSWDDILEKNATSQCAQMVYYETNERPANWRHLIRNGNILTLQYMPCNESRTQCANITATITYVLDDQNGSITTQQKKSQIVVWSSEPIVKVEE